MTDDSRSGHHDRSRGGTGKRSGVPGNRSGRGGSKPPSGRGGQDSRDGRRFQGRDGRDQRREQHTPRDSGGGQSSAAEPPKLKDPGPQVSEGVLPSQLDPAILEELSTLPRTLADTIAKHLVMVGLLIDEDPELACAHAVYARKKASRIGAVREASGLAAYRLGRWQDALSDLRAARRMTGRDSFLAILADCERGLGRPERALELIRESRDLDLPVEERIELRIVASGARRDLGEKEAALAELHGPELNERRARPWAARLFYTYADALLDLGREQEAREYFAKASAVDREGATDADERLAELEGLQIVDTGGDIIWTDAEAPAASTDAKE